MRIIKKTQYTVIKTEYGYISDIQNGKYEFYEPPDDECFIDCYGDVVAEFLYEHVILYLSLTRDERETIEKKLVEQGCKEIRFLTYSCEI